MIQENLFKIIPTEKFDLLTREELVTLCKGEQSIRVQLEKEVKRLRALNNELEQKSLFVEDQMISIKNKLFGKSSERVAKQEPDPKENASETFDKPKKKRVQLPSERYPNTPLIERHITLDQLPDCKCCGAQMKDSGMFEESQYVTKIPAQYYVVVQLRHKYRCSHCYGDLVTAPAPPRVKAGSSYSDEMTIDVACSKYCDLIPIERYAAIAGREGLEELPPQSLIESTHNLADYVKPAYDLLKNEIIESKVLHADETPHRMLEGDKKSSWFLWGFSNKNTSYFEYHDTRSGDVASRLLKDSKCEFLMSDVFSGYNKAVRETNEYRVQKVQPRLLSLYCNAHARRKFHEALDNFPEEAEIFLNFYKKIYSLEKERPPDKDDKEFKYRTEMKTVFEEMKSRALGVLLQYSSKSSIMRAFNYFLENYQGLTRFLENPKLPIDNNPQERLLRNPVIGRKTWYGTHSKRGAETAAILFSLVESCKLNKINPREYIKALVSGLHQGKAPFTPAQFAIY